MVCLSSFPFPFGSCRGHWILAFSRSKRSDVPSTARACAPLKAPAFINRQNARMWPPVCHECRSKRFDSHRWCHVWSRACSCQLRLAACWRVFLSIYFQKNKNKKAFHVQKQMQPFCPSNTEWKGRSSNLVCSCTVKLIDMWATFKALSTSAVGGEHNKMLNK